MERFIFDAIEKHEKGINWIVRIWFTILLVGTIAVFVFALSEKTYAAEFSSKVNATYKTTRKMVIYSKPSSSARKVAEVSAGKKVIVNKQAGNFVRVKYRKKVGWMQLTSGGKYLLKRVVNGWIECGGQWYYKKGNTTFKNKWMYRVNRMLYTIKSKSDYIFVCDKNNFLSMTFYRKNGRWIPHACYTCNHGMVGWETPAGIHVVFKKLRLFHKHGLIFPYACKFWMNPDKNGAGGCFVHSQGCYESADGSLDHVVNDYIAGDKVTHGCISIRNSQAKWFYENCEVGKSLVIVINREFEKWKSW